ncbi:heme oxygenase [Paractinoplanes deccanensis]|uniref:Heme oxygenase n=1 Tax=Paractinoplanes deccanensis TaxID=113561 RepID=A0ABQ3YHB4_9ACTN|nr:biliverdin-producing heme oxygenase [Actinoplanes deccanensis]GID79377.1 heme oxygenase [Actinoplanes deccanensis]
MSDFAARLRRATMVEHREAENRSFISRLMAGSVSREGFAALTAQYLHIYRELEAAALAMHADDRGRAFADPALFRVKALEADLAHLYGSHWETAVVPATATLAYVDRLRSFAHTSAPHFIAHHYVRYLGDLSGGQLVGKSVAQTYALGRAGTRFYSFDGIDDARTYKIAYRARLDALPLTPEEAETAIAEAQLAFRLNAAVFSELGTAYPEDVVSAA